jgi:8-amino-3,8-dideoxy-alpha-D-manno-octulosonate transaminase
MRNGSFKVVEFEKEFARYLGIRRAHAVSSGTSALLALNRVLGFGPGDEIITQAYTFVATAEAIVEVGATPVITEVDKTLNMDPADLERRITERTKAIWVVHMMGGAAKLGPILEIGKKYGIPVLEDTAQALGAEYNGQRCGTLGLAGAFSFDFGKTLTCGEGGMVVVNDEDFYLKVRAYADHGHEDNPAVPRGEDTASFSGMNLRMSELQGAVALAQLAKLEWAISRQIENQTFLKNALSPEKGGFEWREVAPGGVEAGDSLVMLFPSVERRKEVSDALAKEKVGFKLLPGAVKWHFAGRWDHMLGGLKPYAGTRLIDNWPRTYHLLERAIALPVLIKWTEAQRNELLAKLERALYS